MVIKESATLGDRPKGGMAKAFNLKLDVNWKLDHKSETKDTMGIVPVRLDSKPQKGMPMKHKRIENKELLKSYHEKSCVVCGSSPSDPHHIKTRGAGGNDTESNLIALCRNHHIELHKIGQKTFFKKYHLLFNNID